ncbi:MAG: hypothetical protein DHS20C21_06450 [Gemmatimonadota bacterium]|nr:MAG: hypothetical protein DHS20C21_06450 [Gemmatimonadota bacterium]
MKQFLVSILVGALAPGMAAAMQVETQVSEVKWIADREDGARALLSCPLPAEINDQLIVSAHLELSLAALTPTKRIEVTLAAIETAWSPDASWTSPWRSAGGDLDDALAEDFTVAGGRQASTIGINVTQLVRAVAEGGRMDYGMALLPADPLRVGFDAEEQAVLGSLTTGTLVVTYTDLPALGYRGGAQALRAKRRSVQRVE